MGVVAGLITKFIAFDNDMYAVVNWLSIPTYPYKHPLVVCIRDGDPCGNLPRVLPIDYIDPCGACVERCDIARCLYVIRTSGLDTVK